MVCTRDRDTPAEARRWISATAGEKLDDAVIVALHVIATELVANAIAHGRGHIELCFAIQDGRARIEVTDEATDCAVVRIPPVADGVGGRGLRLVEGYASRWGCQRFSDHKMVWADVNL
jgi:anti-sigma regulatory factor (Ser/Thr protein kinase)